MKTFNAKFKKGGKGVFAISLVKTPATEETFIAMSAQEELIKMAKVNEEQRIVMGLVLQPEQLILRQDPESGEKFNIVFSADTIKELSHNFFKSGFQLNSKLEHNSPIKDVTFVESWIVENSEIDKSANFGMSFPKGSWIATMKVDNDDIWNNYVKTGEVEGFSVDAMVDLEEINLKAELKMSENKSIITMLKEIISGAEKVEETVEVALGSVKSGDLDIQFEGDNLEVGTSVFVMNEEEKVALPDGSYDIDGAGTIEVKDGSVESMGEAKSEEPEAEVEAEEQKEELESDEVVAEEVVTEETDAPSNELDTIKSILEEMFQAYAEKMEVQMSAIKADFDTKMSVVTEKNEELKSELVVLSKTPASKAIKSVPTQVALTKQERILNVIKSHDQNK
tara:strand:- start:4113 stop:5297 length:1185 start_codon:yes stop_codon:yes gene_type:complete